MTWRWSSRATWLLVASTAAVTGAQTVSNYEVGLRALGDGRYGDAVTAFEQASTNPTQGTYPLYHLGKAHRCSGRDDAVKQAFESSFFAEDLGGRRDLLEARDRQLTRRTTTMRGYPAGSADAAEGHLFYSATTDNDGAEDNDLDRDDHH